MKCFVLTFLLMFGGIVAIQLASVPTIGWNVHYVENGDLKSVWVAAPDAGAAIEKARDIGGKIDIKCVAREADFGCVEIDHGVK